MTSERERPVRDPDVARLALESLKLVVKAELLYQDLTEHQQSLAAFLEHVGGVTGEQPKP